LPDDEASKVADHLGTCCSCSQEVTDYKALVASAWAVQPGEGLPVAVRRRIATEAVERHAGRGVWNGFRRWMPELPAMRLAGAVATLALLAVVALPMVGRGPAEDAGTQPATRIDVIQDGGVVRLAWNDGEKQTYTVYKSDNPREFSREHAHVVQGNVWTDEAPETSPVVFYRIE
jgi:hypothetical protein